MDAVDTMATSRELFVSGVSQSRKPWWVGKNGDQRWVEEQRITTPEQMLRASRTGWTVSKRPLYMETDPSFVAVKDAFVIARDDTNAPLGVVGGRYAEFQNSDLCDAAYEIAQLGAEFVTGGSLFGGARVWYLLKPDEHEATINGQPFKQFLLATGSHDGSGATRVLPTSVSVECWNTLSLALGKAQQSYSMRHTISGTRDKLVTQAQGALAIGSAYFEAFKADAEKLASIDVELREFQAILDELVPLEDDAQGRARTMRENKRAGIKRAYNSDLYANYKGTGWGVVQAVNDFELWGQTVRGSDRFERQADLATRAHQPLTNQARQLVLAK